ncbi:DUF927 domain-containing protein (plasmid) [Aliarcobacter butzleri]|uniref:DUF927 domain-containing protein n=1 Tax=Aliarcobacter butzleri TaxID=28197 RepID=UPI003B286543
MENEQNFEQIKKNLSLLLQEKKFIEFDKLLTLTAKNEKVGKLALKKEIEALANKEYKDNILNSLPHEMPSNYFVQNNTIFKEIKDGITFVCEYCIVSEIHRTNDNEESLFTIYFDKSKKYISIKSDDWVENKILETILLNNGIYMGDKLKDFKNYITGFIRVNIEQIPTIIRVSKTGWQNINVINGDKLELKTKYCNPIVRPDLTYTDVITNTIFKDGDILTATEILKTALCYKGSCISVLASLASTLIKPLSKNGLSNFIVNFSGGSGDGKTLSSRIGLSMFGNVQEATENSLLNSMNSTAVGNEFLFSQFLDMPILLDEAGTIKGTAEKRSQHIIETIFQFFSGSGKTRGQKNLTLRKTERSRGVLFLTMEYDLKSIERQSGVIEKGYFRRTIEVDSTSGNFLPKKDIFDFSRINSTFGWIAEIFINSITANNYKFYEDLLNDFLKYEKELSRIELAGKEKYFSVLYVVLEHLKRIELITNFEYEKALQQLKIVYDENLEVMTDITTNKIQIWTEILLEFLVINKNKFNGYDKEAWGVYSVNKQDIQEIHIYPSIFSKFCMDNGINERSFSKGLYENGAMITERLTNGGVRYKVKRKNISVFCLLEDSLQQITNNKNTVVEMQRTVESAKKYLTPHAEIKDNMLIDEKGTTLF